MSSTSAASTAAAAGPLPTAAPSPGAPGPLSLADALRIGLERNPQVLAASAAARSAQANFRSVAAFPSLNLGATHVTGTSAAPTLSGGTTDTFLDVGDTVDLSGQRRLMAAAARSQFQAAQYQLDEARLSLSQQIRDAYWSLVVARAQSRIGSESLRMVQQVNQLTKLQLTAGAAPRGDVIRSSIDVANAQQSYVSAQAAERSAAAVLNVLLVRPPFTPIQLADTLTETTTTPTALGDLPGLEALTRQALANRGAVKAAQAQVRAAEYAVKQARAARLPDLAIDYERSLQMPIQSLILGIRLPIFDFGSIRNSVRAAQEARRQAAAQEQQAEQQVIQQVAQAYNDYAQAQVLTASYQSDILAPSNTLISMAQLGYKQGATGILPVIDAERTLRDARTGYLATVLSLYKAQDEVQAALGGLPASPAVRR